VFDQAAINAVKRWRYAPLLVDGAVVEVPVRTRMRFELPKSTETSGMTLAGLVNPPPPTDHRRPGPALTW